MARSSSSRRWLDRHRNDPYVQRVQRDGYRSRAAYKLLEIQEKDRILQSGMRVVDLGAAPGSWSQIAQRLVGVTGRVVALDILPMEPIAGVSVLCGDFREAAVVAALRDAIGDAPLDVVLSDMAPNITGTAVVDQTRAMYLVELALELAHSQLKPGGTLVTKVFQGAGFDDYLRTLRASFKQVASRKPNASRAESREVFLVAKGFFRP
ncbi:23S rRNA (uridine2552-2'-O)-methyltransferase [Allochromatium warmingii]|uniref:Ribosomal RNA large subunit methyltransferase E n=1 Tax=Allochromatium warmingii TaxID=61595 RepID=A0A1H3CVU9_ALLWA|nr:23S rRNA (uridine(2552)-2'-O)-methyltransferase RlmE [Allochromatium warmingii]SDX58333.1 23S rRNA (uridine2552-2'-O)-methyltransferase [Allochromatium warmingii]